MSSRSREWRALEDRLDWSPRRRSFILRPDEGSWLPDSGRASRRREHLRAAGASEGVSQGSRVSPLRPESLADFVGQRRVRESLEVAARAARERGEPAGHALLVGAGGLGKTSLARALAREMDASLHTAMGPSLVEPHQLIPLLTGMDPGDVLFIDEVHRMTRSCEESLHNALEDGSVDVLVSEGSRARTVRIHEPWLLEGGWIVRTPKGRCATPGARARYGGRDGDALARLAIRMTTP